MIKTPKISVVLSVYNCSKYVVESVNSILNQTFTDFEFIIFDDGSNDGTTEILNALSLTDNRIIFIKKEINSGFSGFVDNLNRGLKMSRGKYIARIDSDDVADINRLEVQSKYLDVHTGIFLVATSFNYIDGEGSSISERVLNLNNDQIRAQLPEFCPIHQPTVMFRNEPGIYFRDKALYCEDRDLWLRFATENKKMVVIPDRLLNYRILPTSISHSKKTTQEAYIKKVNEWYLERLNFGYDTYDQFQGIVIKQDISGDALVSSIKIKFKFKSVKEGNILRHDIVDFWKNYGYFSWKPSILYFLATYNNPLSGRIKSILVSRLG